MNSGMEDGRFLEDTGTNMLEWEAETSLQISTASISLIASSAIAAMVIKRENGGLSTPFNRIVFGLSISDVMQSLGFLIGPFSMPSEYKASMPNWWGIGNEGTCKANGFLITLGATAVPMYTCTLCLYYLCKLKRRMSDDEFYHKFEKKIHILIATFNIVVASTALGLNVYHPVPLGTFCHFAAFPTGCRFVPEFFGECDATILFRTDIFQLVISFFLPCMCLIVIVTFMGMLYWHALRYHNMYRDEVPTSTTGTSLRECSRSTVRAPISNPNRIDDEGNSAIIESNDTDSTNTNNIDNPRSSSRLKVQHLSRLYKNEVLIQSSCYVVAFCITYLPVLSGYALSVLVGVYPSSTHKSIGVILYPLGGLFNILTYTRPEVASLRRRHPRCSRIRGLWLVLRAGGKLPEGFVPPQCCCSCGQKDNFSFSSGGTRATNSPQQRPNQITQSDKYGIQSNNYFGFVSLENISGSMVAMDGCSATISKQDSLYTPEDKWSYEKGTKQEEPCESITTSELEMQSLSTSPPLSPLSSRSQHNYPSRTEIEDGNLGTLRCSDETTKV